jgi:hypothetical protein
VGPVKVDFLNQVFYDFLRHFDCSFQKNSFQPHENYSRDLFRAFFAQKVVFGKVTFGPFGVFVRVFNSVQLL